MTPSGSPLLDQYNRDGVVTPGLKRAMDIFKQRMPQMPAIQGGGQPQPEQPTAAPLRAPGTEPQVPKLQMPQPGGEQPMGVTPLSPAPPAMGDTAATPAPLRMPEPQQTPSLAHPAVPGAAEHQSELARLTTGQTGKSGAAQIHNPWLRGLATAGDIALSTFLPQAAMLTPGTQYHHNMLVNQQKGLVDLDDKLATGEERRHQDHAQAVEQENSGPLHEAQTRHANAQADALEHPKPERITGTVHESADGDFWVIHPDGSATQVAPNGTALKAKTKEEGAGSVHTDGEGKMWVVKPDGSAVPVAPKGQPGTAPAQLTGSTGNETADYKNYQKDKAEGFKGTFADWQNIDANRRKPVTHITMGEGDKLLTPAEAAQLGVPYGTTRTQAAGRMPATEGQKKEGLYATRMERANKVIGDVEAAISSQGPVGQAWQGAIPNFMKSDETQVFEQAKRDFVNAILRQESGAAISPSEFASAEKQYFPQAGDSPKVLEQKKINRRIALEGMAKAAGNAYEGSARPAGIAGGSPANAPAGDTPRVTSKAEYDALKSGSMFIDAQDGKKYRKP